MDKTPIELMCEALRQQGWEIMDVLGAEQCACVIPPNGVAMHITIEEMPE